MAGLGMVLRFSRSHIQRRFDDSFVGGSRRPRDASFFAKGCEAAIKGASRFWPGSTGDPTTTFQDYLHP